MKTDQKYECREGCGYTTDDRDGYCPYCECGLTPVTGMPEDVPDPGSDEAIEAGCTCPVLDNAHGEGYMGTGQYVISGDCPIHEQRL